MQKAKLSIIRDICKYLVRDYNHNRVHFNEAFKACLVEVSLNEIS